MDSKPPPPGPQSSIALCKGAESINVSDMQSLLSAPVGNNNTITNIFNANPNFQVDGGNAAPTNSHDENISNIATSRADHEIYFSQLLTKKRGFPLWVPGPNRRLPIEYRRQGISLGDVGIINALGAFCFLFNIFQSVDHPINDGLVPPGFSPLSLNQLKRDIQEDEVYGPETYLASSSVRRVSTDRISETFVNQKFESTASEAAILIMPDGAVSEDLQNTEGICHLIASNAAEWYKYATVTRGRKVKNGDIRVVVGVDKASSWGIATSACNATQTAVYEFKHDPIHTYRWNCSAGSGRAGPHKSDIRDLIQDNKVPKNQCIFVRTMNFTLSGEIWNNFPSEAVQESDPGSGGFGAGGSDSINRGRSRGGPADGTGGTSSGHQPSSAPGGLNLAPSVIFDPVELGVKHPSAMLHHVLHEKFPDANVVISEDMNWIWILNDDDVAIPEPNDLCNRILKTHKLQFEAGLVQVLRKDVSQKPTTSSPDFDQTIETLVREPEKLSSFFRNLKLRLENHRERGHASEIFPPLAQLLWPQSKKPQRPRKLGGGRSVVSNLALPGRTASGRGPKSTNELRDEIEESKKSFEAPEATNLPYESISSWGSRTQSEPLKWSAIYHPEVGRVLDFELVHLFTCDSRVICGKMSPDGERLAIGHVYDVKTYIKGLETMTEICVFKDRYVKDRIYVSSVQFSPDGQLATGASDNQIRIWDITQKLMRAKFNGHKRPINSIAFSPNARSLVSGSWDKSVRIWNIRDGVSNVLPATGGTGAFFSVAFSPNGRYIAGGNMDHSLYIWDSRTHKLVAKWRGHTDCVLCTEFTPDSKGLISGGDQTVKFWDVSLLGTPQRVSRGMVANEGFPEVWSLLGSSAIRSFSLLPGGSQWIVTSSNDRTVRVWDTQSGVCQLTFQAQQVLGVGTSGAQNFLAIADDDRVALWKYEVLQK